MLIFPIFVSVACLLFGCLGRLIDNDKNELLEINTVNDKPLNDFFVAFNFKMAIIPLASEPNTVKFSKLSLFDNPAHNAPQFMPQYCHFCLDLRTIKSIQMHSQKALISSA